MHLGYDLAVERRSCLVELFPRSELFREFRPHADMYICEKPVVPTHGHAHGIPVQVSASEDLENGVDALFAVLHYRLVTQGLLHQVLYFSHLLFIDCLYLQVFADLLAVVTPSDVRVGGSESQEVSLLAGFFLLEEVRSTRPAQVLVKLICQVDGDFGLLFDRRFCCSVEVAL